MAISGTFWAFKWYCNCVICFLRSGESALPTCSGERDWFGERDREPDDEYVQRSAKVNLLRTPKGRVEGYGWLPVVFQRPQSL